MYQINFSNNQKFMNYGKQISKRKNAGSNGNAQLKPRKKKEQDEIVYALTDVKETVVTENFYQPIHLSILKKFMPKGMMK